MPTLQPVQWQLRTVIDLAHVLPLHQMPVQSSPGPHLAAVPDLPNGVPPTWAYQRPKHVTV